MTVTDTPEPRWRFEHDPGCDQSAGWDAYKISGTAMVVRQCRSCGMVRLVLPPDTSTPKARYRAGLPQRRTDRKKDRP